MSESIGTERFTQDDQTPHTIENATPFPLSLVIQLMYHCVWNNPKTRGMKCSEITAAIGALFDQSLIDQALTILRGK